jgi:hypothetical protein
MTVDELIGALQKLSDEGNGSYEVFFEPDDEDMRTQIRSAYVSAIYANPPEYFDGDDGPEIVKDPLRYIIAVSADPP